MPHTRLRLVSITSVLGTLLTVLPSCVDISFQDIHVTNVYPKSEYPIDTAKAGCFRREILANTNGDSFIFFTDPHLLNQGDIGIYDRCNNYLFNVSDYKRYTNCQYVLCGGDWLGNSDWPNQAIDKLSYTNYVTYQLFGENYIPFVGNHDTNYQGYSNDGVFLQGELSLQEYVSAYMPRIGRSYYSRSLKNTTLYVLDSYTDWERSITPYKEQQLEWIASQLDFHDNPHSAVCTHIYFENSKGVVTSFASKLADIILAYNARRTVAINERTIDYSHCSGHIEFVLCGHIHEDYSCILDDGTPVIATDDMRTGSIPTFDLINVNYDTGIMSFYRVGSGNDRQFSIGQDSTK